jgi:hypothetical protein
VVDVVGDKQVEDHVDADVRADVLALGGQQPRFHEAIDVEVRQEAFQARARFRSRKPEEPYERREWVVALLDLQVADRRTEAGRGERLGRGGCLAYGVLGVADIAQGGPQAVQRSAPVFDRRRHPVDFLTTRGEGRDTANPSEGGSQ